MPQTIKYHEENIFRSEKLHKSILQEDIGLPCNCCNGCFRLIDHSAIVPRNDGARIFSDNKLQTVASVGSG